MKKAITSTVIICIILVLAWYGYKHFFTKQQAQQRQMPPTIIQNMTAQQRQWQKTIQATGSLSASEGIVLSPEVAGRITQIYFKSGQYVAKGTPLVQLYPDIIKAELEKAKAQLSLSTANYQRYLKLYKKGFYDKADLDKAKALLQSDQADVNNFQAQLDQLLIKAPFSGQLGLRKISIGDFLNIGEAIVNLQAIDPIRIDFNIPEIYLNQIKIGDKITIQSRALADKTYTGNIYAFDSKIDENSRTLGVRASIPNEQHKLLPGTFVEVTIYLGKPTDEIIIPATAVVYELDNAYVYLMKNHQAIKTAVTLGTKLDDNKIIIVKGINAGDIVITAGLQKIFDRSPVVTMQEFQQMQQQMMQKSSSTIPNTTQKAKMKH